MRISAVLALAGLAAISAVSSHADVIPVSFSGSLMTGPISGTLTYDTSSGQFLQGSFEGSAYGVPFAFTAPTTQREQCNVFGGCQYGITSDIFTKAEGYDFDLLVPGSLGGYQPGKTLNACGFDREICIYELGYLWYSTLAVPTEYQYDVLSEGTLSFGSPAATPEPSSIALLGTGVVGLVGLVRQRFA